MPNQDIQPFVFADISMATLVHDSEAVKEYCRQQNLRDAVKPNVGRRNKQESDNKQHHV